MRFMLCEEIKGNERNKCVLFYVGSRRRRRRRRFVVLMFNTATNFLIWYNTLNFLQPTFFIVVYVDLLLANQSEQVYKNYKHESERLQGYTQLSCCG